MICGLTDDDSRPSLSSPLFRRLTWCAILAIGLVAVPATSAEKTLADNRLVIAFSSLRDRPAFASLYLYEHDGVGNGRVRVALPTATDRSYTNGSLTADGGLCLYTEKQVGGFAPRLKLFDVRQESHCEAPTLPGEFASLTHASLSGNGDLLAFSAWDQPGQPGGWDLFLLDRKTSKLVDSLGTNTAGDEREIAISGDGNLVAFVSNRPDGVGLSDILIFDRSAGRLVATPELNSAQRELNPAWSADGKQLAFVSDRPGGAGGKDVYVYHLNQRRTESLPQVNSVAHEQSPSLTRDGRFLVFVSERVRGEGERDIYLWDRSRATLLPTPGLNSPTEDFDPSVAMIVDKDQK